jgi:hypothetical protein
MLNANGRYRPNADIRLEVPLLINATYSRNITDFGDVQPSSFAV